MAAASGGETKQGLVVTLVFFVLATIGLGVFAYMTASDQDKLKADVKKKTEEAKTSDDQRDWYMFQAALLRYYAGFPPKAEGRLGRELPQRKASFDSGQFGNKFDDYQEVKDMVGKLEARSKWDSKDSKPADSYERILEQRDKSIRELQQTLGQMRKDLADAQGKTRNTEADLEKAKTDHTQKLADAQKSFTDQLDAKDKENRDLSDRYRKAAEELQPDLKRKTEENAQLLAQNKGLSKELKAEKEKSTSLQDQIGALRADAERRRPTQLVPRGEVVRVHANQRGATISLGRSQALTAGTTFAVHGTDSSGRVKPLSKGIVEVVTVGDNSSDVLVRELYHPDPDEIDIKTGGRRLIDPVSLENKDPIARGDKLINPLWDPDAVTHVAIAGQIELGGVRFANVAGLIRQLEKQKVVVDAFIDPTDGAVKGPGITRKTKYLILGSSYAGGEGGLARNETLIKQMNESREKLRNEAKNNAVDLVNPDRFLSELNLGRD